MTFTRARLRRLLPFAVVVGMLAVASSAVADGPYTDTVGDGSGAPDIQTVEVTNDDSGQITLRVHVDNLPSPSDLFTTVYLNTDRDSETGGPSSIGTDYLVSVDHADNSYVLARWDGSNWVRAPSSTLSVVTTSTSVTLSTNRSELGNTDGFNFWVVTINSSNLAQHDVAPDHQTWSYTLAVKPVIQSVVTVRKPATGPRAGKPFTVRPSGLHVVPTGGSTLPKPDSYTCTARLGGKRLAGRSTGKCTWKLPKTRVHGKRLAVTMTVNYRGANKTVQLGYRVK